MWLLSSANCTTDYVISSRHQFAACCLVAVACAAPQFRQNTSPVIVGQPEVRILSENFENDDSGNYQYSYEQDDGQRVSLETRENDRQTSQNVSHFPI